MMHVRRGFVRAALLLLTGLAGCDDAKGGELDDAGPPLVPGPVGDWFLCADEVCAELQTIGLRLAPDHFVHHLHAAAVDGRSPTHFTDGDPYCVAEPFGRYVLHGEVLTLALHDGGLIADTTLVLGDGGVTAHDGAMHKVHPNATGRFEDGECVAP